MFNEFLGGAIVFGFWIVALFFLRFWRTGHDRLFALFSLSFFLLGCERIAVTLMTNLGESHFAVYFIRLAAFGLIIFGIVQKNRPGRG